MTPSGDRRRSATAAPLPSGRRIATLAAVTFVAAVLAASCGLPTDETVQRYDVSDLSPALANTTTTTTTTTTTLPTTAGTTQATAETPPSTADASPTTVVTVYFTLGRSLDLKGYPVKRGFPVATEEVIGLLENPTGINSLGLRTWVRPGLIDSTAIDRGIFTVSLDRALLDRMSDSEERQAIAQIVLTFTSFVTADAGAIGSVRFEVDGEGYAVYNPFGGGNSERGEPLTFDDFKQLIVLNSADEADSSSTTTATTTTTEPAPTTPTTTSPVASLAAPNHAPTR